MDTLWQDLRHGIRMLFRKLGFTAVAVISLALGIGANSTIFSLVDGLFLRPWPVQDPDQLAEVFSNTERLPEAESSYADYADLRDHTTVFSGLVAHGRRGAILNVDGQTEFLLINVVSENYFSVLGVKAARGRTFRPEQDQRLRDEPAVVISDGLWQRRFGGNPEVVGKTIQLNKKSFTIVGIAPRRFHGLARFLSADVWVPFTAWAVMVPGERVEREPRDSRWLELVGRLRSGVTVEQARAELDLITRRLAEAYPATNKGLKFSVISETERTRKAMAPTLFIMSIVMLVLLISCANVANLLLAQAETRRHEIAMRLALGSSRSRLVRQLLTESVMLSLMGAVLGLVLTRWLIDLLPALMPPSPVPLSVDVRLDERVLGFTLILSMLTTLFFGLIPAIQASKQDLVSVLKGEEANLYRGSRRFSVRNALVVGQIAVSLILLTAAGLLLKSLLHSQRMDPGFDTNKNMLLLMVAPGYGPERTSVLYHELMERFQALPGVKRASYARRVPLSGSGGGATQKVSIPESELPPGENTVSIKYNAVGLNYFQTMGTRILRGRDFDQRDGPTGLKVVLINETMARRFWPNEDPIGKRLRVESVDYQIIGVVADGKINGLHETPEPYLYFPFAQMPSGETTLLVETAVDPRTMVASVKRVMQEVDRNVPILGVMTLQQHMQFALYGDRMAATLAGSLGLLGMFLAIVGLYGVVSYAVNRRTHEIGVRMALGAQPADIFKMVVGQGMILSVVGVSIGVLATLGLTRFISSLLYGVSTTDPTTFAAISLLLIGVALVASYLPARKATKVDPMVALRYE